MSSTRRSRLKAWISRKTTPGVKPVPTSITNLTPLRNDEATDLENPIENFYRHKAKLSLPFFYRFALQTRSLAIRDIFAKIASKHGLNLVDLLSVIANMSSKDMTEEERNALNAAFDDQILLVLADLLANTARDDLDIHAAVQIYDFVLQVYGDELFSAQNKLQYVEALNELSNYNKADGLAITFKINEIAPLQQELLHLYRLWRTADTPQDWLGELNAFYRTLGMSEVKFLESDSVPLMDRLAVAKAEPIQGPKISVIMPTFSPGDGIRTAIRSLLEQTWQNIEIVVVNDASPTEYCHIFDEIEEMDPCIRVIHQDKNAGAYVARNAGRTIATGDFITTHDDDDWSHPDKLATQIKVLLEDESIVATTSAHIRTSGDVEFRRVNMQAQFLQMNYSSLMFRRSVTEEIGPWDTVNRGGDSEFYTRLIENYGEERVVGLHDRPLSFSRIWDGSLTSGEMSRGYFAYSRLLYRWAFRQWHWSSSKRGEKAIRKPGDVRPYPVPPTFEAGQRDKVLGHLDVIYVTDFFRQAKHVERAVQELETLSDFGLKVGYMHLYSPETKIPAGIPPRLFELQMASKVTQIGLEDDAETKLLVLHDSAIGMFLDQITSRVKTRRSVVIDHKTPTLVGGKARTPTVLSQAVRNLDRTFDTCFEVTGGTAADHERTRSQIPKARLLSSSFIWHTHITTAPSQISPPKSKPVVGFHSYGNQYRWPNNADTFSSIYVSNTFTTRLFGQLDVPIQRFGEECFNQIEVVKPEDETEAEFLENLDFWVYYPHYRLQDQVWEQVLSAMQAGKVVILPHRLEAIYGAAAVYAEPSEIPELVSRYAVRPNLYSTQAQKGQRFVNSGHTADDLRNRVTMLME